MKQRSNVTSISENPACILRFRIDDRTASRIQQLKDYYASDERYFSVSEKVKEMVDAEYAKIAELKSGGTLFL